MSVSRPVVEISGSSEVSAMIDSSAAFALMILSRLRALARAADGSEYRDRGSEASESEGESASYSEGR